MLSISSNKLSRFFILCAWPLTLIAALPPVAKAVELVVKDDFESPSISTLVTYSSGQTFNGWTVGSGDIDQLGGQWQYGFEAASGKQLLDLNGFQSGAIYKDLSTIPNQTYTLNFALAGNPNIGTSGTPIKLIQIWWGSTLVDTLSIDTTGRSNSNLGWQYYHYQIVAPAATTRLKFVSLTPGNSGPTLDDVTVTSGVPHYSKTGYR